MKHLIDYPTLKKWGFKWASKQEFNGEIICTSYILEDTSFTDLFGFDPVHLSMYPHPTLNVIWFLSRLGNGKSDTFSTLFQGVIKDKQALEIILSSCIVFKISKQQVKTRGLFSVAFNIPEKEIDAITTKFREKFPDDKRTDEELRPYTINQIIRDRSK